MTARTATLRLSFPRPGAWLIFTHKQDDNMMIELIFLRDKGSTQASAGIPMGVRQLALGEPIPISLFHNCMSHIDSHQ